MKIRLEHLQKIFIIQSSGEILLALCSLPPPTTSFPEMLQNVSFISGPAQSKGPEDALQAAMGRRALWI